MGRLSPVNFWQQARQFVDASEREFDHAGRRISIPGYFLAARSLELGLKSFLLIQAQTENDLKAIGHNLDRGLKVACDLGLSDAVELDDRDRMIVSDINSYYVTKDLEYVTTGYKSYPDPRLLLATVRRLLDGIAPLARAWRAAD